MYPDPFDDRDPLTCVQCGGHDDPECQSHAEDCPMIAEPPADTDEENR